MSKMTALSMAIMAAMILAPSAMAGGDHGDENGDDVLAAERICQLEANVPVIFRVGECIERDGFAFIPVKVNTRTRVSVTGEDFKRFERDCDGKLLNTFDTIAANLAVIFVEVIECPDGGAPLEVKSLDANTWCVNPHRGGYLIKLRSAPSAFDICDDAGCYTANVKVLVTAEPFEDCP